MKPCTGVTITLQIFLFTSWEGMHVLQAAVQVHAVISYKWMGNENERGMETAMN